MTVARVRSAVALAGVVVAAFCLDPDRPLPFDLCLFHQLTGLPCPFCGLTRAFCHALHGQWSQSLAYHPAGILLAAAVSGRAVWLALDAMHGRSLQAGWYQRAVRVLGPAGAAVSLLGWMIRLSST